MIQYCYTSLVLVSIGSATNIREGFMLDVSFMLKLTEIRIIKSVYSVTLNYCAHEEILKCKLTNFSVSIHSEYVQLTYSVLSFQQSLLSLFRNKNGLAMLF